MSTVIRAVCAFALASAAWAQTPPAFEVATIKPSAPPVDGRMMMRMGRDPGRVDYANLSLKNIIANAYSVRDFQISGPEWLDSVRFDVQAKMPEGAKNSDIPAMLQTLLADRFKLAAHKESKVMPAYELVLAKGGAKLKEAPEKTGIRMMMGPKGRHLSGQVPMSEFVGALARWTDRPVVDKTGLTGIYDFDLEWSGDDSPQSLRALGPPPGAGGPGGPHPPDESADAPPLVLAVQEKLGLRLEARKTPVDIIVVDHAERSPTEN